MLFLTQPEIEGNDANDLKLQSRDSREDPKDDAPPDCSEMVGFASLSFEVMLQTQPSKNVTVQYKERSFNVSRQGALSNITLCQAHFQSLFLMIIAQSLKPLNLLSTKDT